MDHDEAGMGGMGEMPGMGSGEPGGSGMHDMPGMAGMQMGPGPNADPDQHAFVMLGTETMFLWHLPMLRVDMDMHKYEFVLKAHLDPAAKRAWLEDRSRHGGEVYFLGNSDKDLMTIASLAIGAKTSFQASVWAGIPPKHRYCSWPWEHQEPIVEAATVTIERVVAYRHFDVQENYPACPSYLLFGEGNEAYLAHRLTRQPDYDEVVILHGRPSWLPEELLQAGVPVSFPGLAATPTPCSTQLLNKTYTVEYGGEPGAAYPVTIKQNLWFNTKIPNDVDPCEPDEGPCPPPPSSAPATTSAAGAHR